jgi:integrase/recombinase XerD
MTTRSDREPAGPLAMHLVGFRAELVRLGYSKSPLKRHLQLLAQLSRWLEREDLGMTDLATDRVEVFFQARREAGYVNLRTPMSLVPLLSYLRRVGALVEPESAAVVGPVEELIEDFRLYLVRERGLVEGTIRFYLHVARLFVVERVDDEGLSLGDVTAVQVSRFVSHVCEGRSLSSARQVVSALRALLRFLRFEGLTDLSLDQAVLSVAGWNPGLPRAIAWADARRLLDSCDRSMPTGRRDYAILLLLARLGLRAGEVVTLELDDVDWRSGEVVVVGKRQRRDRLPLPVDVGEALVAYLRWARPISDSRRIFLRCCAPFCGLAGSGAIRGVLARACERAGLPYVSPHRLRHTAATEMLRRGGSLIEIGQVLRQDSAVVTAVYAKVDQERLRMVARPWPGGAT